MRLKKSSVLVAGVALVALIGTAGYWWRQQQASTAAPDAAPAIATPTVVPPAASAASAPGIQYPIEAPVDNNQQAATPLDVETALADLFGRKAAQSMFQTQDFARRFVATVDNLGRSHAPMAMWPMNPTAGRLTDVPTERCAEGAG
jgi:hypothetical protein